LWSLHTMLAARTAESTPRYAGAVKRALWLLLLLAVIGAVTVVTLRLRESRAGTSQLGGSGELPGSLDTWPEVPRKQVA